jgi:hypothetical protein
MTFDHEPISYEEDFVSMWISRVFKDDFPSFARARSDVEPAIRTSPVSAFLICMRERLFRMALKVY